MEHNPLPSPKEIAMNEVAGLPPEMEMHKEAIAAIVEKAIRTRDWQTNDILQQDLGNLRQKIEMMLRS